MRLLSFGAGLVALFGTSAALAADLPAEPADPVYYAAEPVSTYHFFDEVRIGATGFLDDRHRLTDEEEGVFLNGEVLFGNPMTPFDNRFVDFLLRPRPHIGGTVTTSGGTNQIYAGLTWDYNLTNRIFLEGTFGGTIHDGNTDHVETAPASAARRCFGKAPASASTSRSICASWPASTIPRMPACATTMTASPMPA